MATRGPKPKGPKGKKRDDFLPRVRVAPGEGEKIKAALKKRGWTYAKAVRALPELLDRAGIKKEE